MKRLVFIVVIALFLGITNIWAQVIEGVSNSLYVKPKPKPKLEIISFEGNVVRQQISTLKLIIKNSGEGQAEDVRIVFDLPQNAFPTDRQDYNLGNIQPGYTKEIKFKFVVNANYSGSDLPIDVKITEKSGKTDLTKTINLPIEFKPIEILEIQDVKFTDNNKNGVLDGNEIAMLAVQIKNTSTSTVSNLKLKLTIPDYVLGITYPPVQVVGSIGANQTKTVSIPITGTADLQTGTVNIKIKAEAENGIVSNEKDFTLKTQIYLPEEIAQTTEAVEDNIEQELEDYTEQMRQQGIISENVQTDFNTEVFVGQNEEGEQELNLKVEYKYEVINKTRKDEFAKQTDDFPPGAYDIKKSNAAKILMTVFKKTVEEQLSQYITDGKNITIKITGMTDATPITGKIPYNNEFGPLVNKEIFYNGLFDDVTVTSATGITTNKQLGYLRTMAVRNFIEKYVKILSVANVSYEHYVIVSNKRGGKYRRIEIELIIHDAFSEKYPELVEQVLKSDVDVEIPENNITASNTYAIVIGNEHYSKYQTDLTPMSDVDFAINDAKMFKLYLVKTFGVPEDNITFLPDAQAYQIKRALNKIAELTRRFPNQLNIIFYYAGHGYPDKDSIPYILPVDISASDLENAISLNFVYQKLTENPAKKVIVFLDACFSGGGRKQGPNPARVGFRRAPKNPLQYGNIVVLASSSGSQISLPYNSKGHGLYTYFLLKNFKQSNGNISLGQLADNLKNQVSKTAITKLNKEQDPQVIVSPKIQQQWKNWKIAE